MNEYLIGFPFPDSIYKEVDIKSKKLHYIEIENLASCQVNNQENRTEIRDKCIQIADLIREIEALNKIKQ